METVMGTEIETETMEMGTMEMEIETDLYWSSVM